MLETSFFAVLFWLLVGHAVGDFALQTEWMVRAKNPGRRSELSAVGRDDWIWVHVLTGHSLVHGGAVALATGSPLLGVAETAAHWLIDFGKCQRWYSFHVDQCLHLGCKLIWTLCWLAL